MVSIVGRRKGTFYPAERELPFPGMTTCLFPGGRVDIEHAAERGHGGEGLLVRHPVGQARRRREEEARVQGKSGGFSQGLILSFCH